MSCDAATGMLTLDNATITGSDMTYQDGGGAYGQYGRTYHYHGIRYDTGGDLVVRLVGKNEVRQTDGSAGDFRAVFGIMTSADLTLTGSGSLSVVNDCSDENTGIECGILAVDSNATVKVGSTGELKATGDDRALSPSTKVKLGSSKLKVMSWKEEISASEIGTHQNIHIYIPKDAQKKVNPITVKAKKVTFSASKVKKKAQYVKASKAFTVKKAQGEVTYKKSESIEACG